MYYSTSIWNLHYMEGKTVKEIVDQLATPLLNEQFVSTVINNNRKLRASVPTQRDTPFPKIYKRLNSMVVERQKAGLHRRVARKTIKNLW